MTTLVATDAVVALLGQAKGLAEVRDSQGKVIGFFAPASLEHAADYARAAAHFDPQELRRRKDQNDPGRPTQQVIEDLRSREATG